MAARARDPHPAADGTPGTPAATAVDFAQFRQNVGEGFGRVLAVYGLNPLYGRIYGTLFMTTQPLSLEQVAQLVGTAKSTASVALRQMEAFEVVRRRRKLGDRRDYYEVQTDLRAMGTSFVRNFVVREAEEGWKLARLLSEGMAHAGGEGWPDAPELELLQHRVAALVRLTEVGQKVLDRVQKLLRVRRERLRWTDWVRALGEG